jgi:hypothetical protein
MHERTSLQKPWQIVTLRSTGYGPVTLTLPK